MSSKTLCAFLLCALEGIMSQAARAATAASPGEVLYAEHCAACHDAGNALVPSRGQLASRAPEDIVRALTSGSMRVQAEHLSESDIRVVAEFVTRRADAKEVAPPDNGKPAAGAPEATGGNPCKAGATGTLALDAAGWNGWGRDVENSRFQPSPGLRAEDVSRLKLKWAFGYPGKGVRGQPTVVGGRLFVAGPAGHVFSLDAASGCTYWMHKAKGNVRSAISVGALPKGSAARYAAYFGDDKGFVQAVDALTGSPLWSVLVDEVPGTIITGAPTLYKGRLYVPASSSEEKLAGFLPKYECCKFRGSITALDAATGKRIWKTYTIAGEPKAFKKSGDGRDVYGPAGGAVWSAPTIDVKRRRLYAVTGNSYTDAEAPTTDAILAFDLETGALLWTRQKTKNDNYLLNCAKAGTGNCPDAVGDDFDFGATPILHTLPGGRRVLLAGQKSGTLYALDPDRDGELLWQDRFSPGGLLGGIQWGPATDRDSVYVAISDVVTAKGAAPALHAVDIARGRRRWSKPAPTPPCAWGTNGCSHAQSAAVTAIPGVVFSGALDGHLRAYASGDGAILWDVDTAGSHDTVNGLAANGGSLDTGGAVVVGGVVYVNSGYALVAGRPGNVLLAFSVDGK